MSAELKKLKAELEFRKTAKRAEIAKELRHAEELGDLFRENFPYDAAVADQRHNETRIINLEEAIKSLSTSKNTFNRVQIGSVVELVKEDDTKMIVRLVDEAVFRSRVYSNAITIDSPLGKALANKKAGDLVKVVKSYKILDIY